VNASYAIAAGLVLVSFSTGALAGFGSVIIALTLGAHTQPIEWWVVRLVPLNLFLNGYLVLRHGAHADRRLVLTRVLPLMGLGAAGGYAVAGLLSGPTLKVAFGVFVVVLAAKELLVAAKILPTPTRPLPGPLGGALMTLAGVIHGIYASGGPLLVYTLSRAGLMKASFRSTLAVIWLALNVALTAAFLISGRLDEAALVDVLSLLPVVVLATALGEWGHHKIDEARFRVVVFTLLLVAGGALVLR